MPGKTARRTDSQLTQLVGGLIVIGSLYLAVVIASSATWARVFLGAAFVCAAVALKTLWTPARVLLGIAGLALAARAFYAILQ